MKPTWLFIDLATDFGGHEVMLLQWIEELRRQGEVEPILVCAKASRLAQLGPLQLSTYEVDTLRGSLAAKLLRFAKLMQQLYALKRAHRPVITVIAEGCLMAQRHAVFATRAVGLRSIVYVPLVSSFTDMGFPNAERLEQRMRSSYRKLPSAWITITPHQAEELRSWSGAEQPVFCLPNTVAAQFEESNGHHAANAIDTPARQSKILVLGRLDPHQKGLDLLLQHLTNRPALARDVRVSFVGEGPFLPAIQAALSAHPWLAELMVVEGWQDASTALAKHDVLLIASRFEGVPLVMLEAMASGVPVVSTDLPGTRPYLPASCLFQFGDFDRAFEIARSLRDDPDLRETVVKKNLKSFADKASPTAFGAAVRELTVQLGALA